LTDVIISIAILVVLASIGMWAIHNAVKLNAMFQQRDAAVRVVASKIRRQISLAFLTPNLTAIESYKTVFVGKNKDPDQLFFASQAHRRLYWDSRESDQTEITIWAEPMPDRSPGHVLYHRESERIDEEPDQDGVIQPLAYNVKTVNFRFLDGVTNEWKEEWDSLGVDQLNRLPRAVELSIVYLLPDPKEPGEWVERPQKTTIPLQHADPIVQNGLNTSGFGR
jgi:hypothetical protein